ncbi:MAG: class I SAM-dependent methyltransferase [Planctomycetota bacterium]
MSTAMPVQPGLPRLTCRLCSATVTRSFADLGVHPFCQRHVEPKRFYHAEKTYPLHAFACDACRLIQLPDGPDPAEIFSDYAFFSGFSETWKRHADDYAVEMIYRLGLTGESLAVEVASNDGTLLKPFQSRGIPVRGIEPAENVADVANENGVATESFFLGKATGEDFADRNGQADVVAANNVLAHVPDLNDFIAGLAALLKPQGVLTVEFPHVRRQLEENQFDTIYHEHWSYFWFSTAKLAFERHGLRVFDVKLTETHGGSARCYCCRADARFETTPNVAEQLELDRLAGREDAATYEAFAETVRETKRKLLSFLIDAKRQGKRVCAYGAPGKGNTLLNYCGIGTDMIDFTVDRNPKKQGNFLPGSRIPIKSPDAIAQAKPDYVLILPWNLRHEIADQMAGIREWGGQFVVPIPTVEVF